MPLPNLPFGQLITSKQLISGQHINNLSYLLTGSIGGLTATPAGTAANSLQLNSAFNEIATVVTTGTDSVTLPPAKSGLRVVVDNRDAADTLKIWANGADTIFVGGVAAASDTLTSLAGAMYIAVKDGQWRRWSAVA